MKIPIWGLTLQMIFVLFITISNPIRVFIIESYSVYPVALFELSLGVISMLCGIYGIFKKNMTLLSLFIIYFGLLICMFFVFIYLFGEGGMGQPPAIPWLNFE